MMNHTLTPQAMDGHNIHSHLFPYWENVRPHFDHFPNKFPYAALNCCYCYLTKYLHAEDYSYFLSDSTESI